MVVNDLTFADLAGELGERLAIVNPDFRALKTRTLGALQVLCLFVVLLHPRRPRLLCIEEPEKGLHPDILPELAKWLVEASARTQLVVTTHSEILVDALSGQPECVVTCQREGASTVMKRLDKRELEVWLKEYSLGSLWRQGHIGANRW